MRDLGTHPYCLINMRSGNGAGGMLAYKLKDWCTVKALEFDKLETLLGEAAHFPLLIIAGGDGSIAAALTHSHLPQVPVLPIPLGTANDLCREYGITLASLPTDSEAFRTAMSNYEVKNHSVWRLRCSAGEFHFVNYCSFGFEGAVIRDFVEWREQSKSLSRIRNRFMYSIFGCKHLGKKISNCSLSCGDGGKEVHLDGSLSFVFANIRSYMGLAFSNVVGDSSDTILECIPVTSLLDYGRMFLPTIVRRSEREVVEQATRYTIKQLPSETLFQVDGESCGAIGGSLADTTPSQFEEVAIEWVKTVRLLVPRAVCRPMEG